MVSCAHAQYHYCVIRGAFRRFAYAASDGAILLIHIAALVSVRTMEAGKERVREAEAMC